MPLHCFAVLALEFMVRDYGNHVWYPVPKLIALFFDRTGHVT